MSTMGHNSGDVPDIDTGPFFAAYRSYLDLGRKSVEQWVAASEELAKVRASFAEKGERNTGWERWLRFHRISKTRAWRMLLTAREAQGFNLEPYVNVQELVEACLDEVDQRRQRQAKIAHAQQQQACHEAEDREKRKAAEARGPAIAAELEAAQRAIDVREAAREAAESEHADEWKVAPRGVGDAPTSEWVTPQGLISSVRSVMGNIDLDPASSELANERVQARMWHGEDDDGLKSEWAGCVWLAPPPVPPEGVPKGRWIGQWVSRLLHWVSSGAVTQAVLMVEPVLSEEWMQDALKQATAVCLCEGALPFDVHGDEGVETKNGKRVLLYFGHRSGAFADEMEPYGVVLVPRG